MVGKMQITFREKIMKAADQVSVLAEENRQIFIFLSLIINSTAAAGLNRAILSKILRFVFCMIPVHLRGAKNCETARS